MVGIGMVDFMGDITVIVLVIIMSDLVLVIIMPDLVLVVIASVREAVAIMVEVLSFQII
jgi:hypothetical protein